MMPTISESTWQEKAERIKQCVAEFIEAKRLSIDDSEDVLSARLFGLGLRGQDLKLEMDWAKREKFERRQRVHTVRIHQPLFGGFPKRWAQGPVDFLTWTEQQNKASKYTAGECIMIREWLRIFVPNAVMTIDGL